MAELVKNPTCIHEDSALIPSLSRLRIQLAVSFGHRLQMGPRSGVGVAVPRPQPGHPHMPRVQPKKEKKKKKKKKSLTNGIVQFWKSHLTGVNFTAQL